MARRAQRWLFWLCLAAIAFQIYVVREWLAALFLLGVVFAGVLALIASGLILSAAWQGVRMVSAGAWQVSRSAATVARAFIAKTILERAFFAGSNTTPQ